MKTFNILKTLTKINLLLFSTFFVYSSSSFSASPKISSCLLQFQTSSDIVKRNVRSNIPSAKDNTLTKKANTRQSKRAEFLERARPINEIRMTLKKEFAGYDDIIDQLVDFALDRILLNPSVINKKQSKLFIVPGPAGIGKTTLFTRFMELLDSRDRMSYVSVERGAVEFPDLALRRLSDQNQASKGPGINLLMVDEMYNLKTISELDSDKEIPDPNQPHNALNGKPNIKIINEHAEREKSLASLLAALGNGYHVRKPEMTPMEYVDELNELAIKYLECKNRIDGYGQKLKDLNSESSESILKDSKSDTQTKLLKYELADKEKMSSINRKVFEIFNKVKIDQPSLLKIPVTKLSTTLSNKDRLLIDLTHFELGKLWSEDADAFVTSIFNQARTLSPEPEESFGNTIIVMSFNPEALINKVHDRIRGAKISPEGYIKAYNQVVTPEKVQQDVLARLGITPAMESRLQIQTVRSINPLGQKEYDQLIHRELVHHSESYKSLLLKLDIKNTELIFEDSVFNFLRQEAVVPIMGPRELFPRLNRILPTLVQRLVLEVVQESILGSIPRTIRVSFDQENRKLIIKPSGNSRKLIARDFSIPEFHGPAQSQGPTEFEKQLRSIYLASMAVVGMAFHRSLPMELSLNVDYLDFSKYYNIEAETHASLRGTIAMLMSGTVGQNLFASGSLMDAWPTVSQEWAMDTLAQIINDINIRKTDFPHLLKVVKSARPKKGLPINFIEARKAAETDESPLILVEITETIQLILKKNQELVELIAQELYRKGSLETSEVSEIVMAYTEQMNPLEKTLVDFKLALGIPGPTTKVSSKFLAKSISGTPQTQIPRILEDKLDSPIKQFFSDLFNSAFSDKNRYWK